MSSLVRGDLDSMMQLRVGLVQSANRYANIAQLLRADTSGLEQSSETNAHEFAVEDAIVIAGRLEALGRAMDLVADGLTAEIDRLTALVELTRRPQ